MLVNETTQVIRKTRMDSLADLVHVASELRRIGSSKPIFGLKAYVAAAHRSLAASPCHSRFSHTLVSDPAAPRPLVCRQLAMPFGAVASVYSWDILVAGLCAWLRVRALLPVLRYVDDLFTAELEDNAQLVREFLLDASSLWTRCALDRPCLACVLLVAP